MQINGRSVLKHDHCLYEGLHLFIAIGLEMLDNKLERHTTLFRRGQELFA